MTDCFSVLLPVFVNMINLSFKDGLVSAASDLNLYYSHNVHVYLLMI